MKKYRLTLNVPDMTWEPKETEIFRQIIKILGLEFDYASSLQRENVEYTTLEVNAEQLADMCVILFSTDNKWIIKNLAEINLPPALVGKSDTVKRVAQAQGMTWTDVPMSQDTSQLESVLWVFHAWKSKLPLDRGFTHSEGLDFMNKLKEILG